MYLSLGQAAKESGKSKATISKYIKNGRISVVSKDDGSYQIDPSELFRVFPKSEQQTGINEQSQTPKETPVNSVLQKEVDLLRERLVDKDSVILDLRERLDKESEERRKLTMLLSSAQGKTPQKATDERKLESGQSVAENKTSASGAKFSAIASLFLIAIILYGAWVLLSPHF